MDNTRFDDLTRAMAAGASRRQVLKGLVGAVAGGAALVVAPGVMRISAQTEGGVAGDECDIEDEQSCQSPYTCFEGLCDIPRGCVGDGLPCVDDFPCCEDEGLTCVDGMCMVAVDASDDDSAGDDVETLPETGTGVSGSSNGWLGAAAAGGAVAIAASLLRPSRKTAEGEPRP